MEKLNERKALLIAPIAILPVALVFILLRSLIEGDLRELIVAPLSAVMIACIGYPFAFGVSSLLWRVLKGFQHTNFLLPVAAIVSAEGVFWVVISPFWQRDFSNAFCVALVGASGLACGGVFLQLARHQVRHY
jgi:hypothetical protein